MSKAVKEKTEKQELKNTEGEFRYLELAKIKPSKFDYRRIYNEKTMAELTQSVKDKGVLEPVLVRPAGKDFELVCGRRRRLAAVSAKLKTIPAIIKNLSDEEALETQIIENEQREDVNPICQAQGFKRLLDMGKHTAETLAERLGKTTAYVYGRLKFLDLSPKVQDMIAEDKISAGHAVMLIRLRDKKKQESIANEIVQHGQSVRDTAQDVKNCYVSLKRAVFDTTKCAKCEFNTDNQAALFLDMKKTGECADVNCFSVKIKAYFAEIAKDLKSKGFKVITREDEAGEYHNNRNSIRIVPPDSEEHYEKPKRYKSECMKCTDHHIYCFYEKKNWDKSSSLEFYERCTNARCLDKMQGRLKNSVKNTEESSKNVSPYTIAAHARECRDRFLKANLPGKVEASEVLKKRLLIYTLLLKYGDGDDMNAVIKMFNPKYEDEGYHDHGWDGWYAVAQGITEAKLDDAIKKILIASIKETDPLALLRMTTEAGIDMTKDFGPDEEFLKTKTKDELVKFASDHKLAVDIKPSDKKGDIVKAIIVQDLRGKHTKELKECIEIKESEEEDEEEGFCEGDGDCENCDKAETCEMS